MSEMSEMYYTVVLFEIAFYTGLWMFKGNKFFKSFTHSGK